MTSIRLSDLSDLVPWIHGFALCFGCVVGSFLNVVVWRIPRGESLWYPPSRCPVCGHGILWWENIPVLSWLMLRGRCSGCKERISIRYPLGELAMGLGFLAVFHAAYVRELPAAFLPAAVYVFGSILCVTQMDWKHRLISDQITWTGIAVSLLLALFLPSGRLIFGEDLMRPESGTFLFRTAVEQLPAWGRQPGGAVTAALIDWGCGLVTGAVPTGAVALAGTVFGRILKRPGTVWMGWGDVKYLMMLGAFLGADAALCILCIGSCTGFATGLVWYGCSRGRHGGTMPFGPFLSLGALVWLLFGRPW